MHRSDQAPPLRPLATAAFGNANHTGLLAASILAAAADAALQKPPGAHKMRRARDSRKMNGDL